MRKRILSVLLSLCMIVTLLPMAVFATGGYQDYQITEHNLTHVQNVLDGVAEVTQDGGNIVIKLISNINGRLHIGEPTLFSTAVEGDFVLNLNGKTIDAGNELEAICLDNNFSGNFIITGSGTMKTGYNHIIYTYDATITFEVEDGYDYFTLKKDGNNYFADEKNTATQTEGSCIDGSELVMTQSKEASGEEFSYAYDVYRDPAFPSYYGEEIEVYNFDKPLNQNGQEYSSSEGTWTLEEEGPYSNFVSLSDTNLDDIVEYVADEYNLSDDGKNGLVIHKLTDENDNLVGYGVVIGVDETNGYTLFIGDALGGSGAGYFLSMTEITENSITFNTDKMAQSTYAVELDETVITFTDAVEDYAASAAQTITVTNTGDAATGTLNITLSGGSSSNFELSKDSIVDIVVNGNDTFTVVPKIGLAAGTYEETITLSGEKIMPVIVPVSFTVVVASVNEFEATASVMYSVYYNSKPYVGIKVETSDIPNSATEYGVEINDTKYPATSGLFGNKFVVDIDDLSVSTTYTAKVYYTNGRVFYAEDVLNFTTPAAMLSANGYFYADGDNVAYSYTDKGIDIKGKDGNGSWIQSTYSQDGWPMAYNTTSTVHHTSPKAKRVCDNNVDAWVVPQISDDGYFVKITYFIRNITGTEINGFKFGASADVQIGNVDYAPIRKTEYGLELSDGTNTFALLLNDGYVETPVTTKWFGGYLSAASNVYNNIDSDSLTETDSGVSYSWQNITIAPGEIKSYEVVLGVGDSDTLGSILTPSADIEYEDEALLDLEAGELYKITCDGVTYEITAESGGSIALAGKDNNDTDYNFIGKTISVVEVVNGEESAPQEVTIANRPVAVVPAKIVGDGEIELPDELDVVTTDTTITIKADENQVYSIDNGTTWVTPTEGSVTFAGLTDGTTYTIWTKVNATSTSFASLNAEFEVKAAKMFDASDVEITGTSIVYDGEAHGITAQAEGAEAMYSSALNGSYTSECPTYTNVSTYSIYYKISKEGYHDYYGVGTLEILPKKISTTINLAAPVANAAPMLNVENEEYTAVVVWSPAVTDKFDYSTAYTANITITPTANYTLTGVTENEFVITGATVTNAADSGDVTAVFEATGAKRTGGGGGVSRYTVKFDTNGGTTVANKTVTRNSKLAEPTAPVKDGYTFDGWYTDKELTTAYDFDTKVTKSFTLYAKWVEAKATHVCPSEKFSDLDTTKWYHEDIDYVLDNEIMLGTSETVFAPEGSLTRGMLVTILYRSEGEPATNKSIPFADVDMGAYYANAVIWAQQNGIVKGISKTEYAPDMNVTREQLATIMFRYAQFKGMDALTMEENLHFEDASDISEWAITSMNWGVGKNYIFSRTEGKINPMEAATRAEIAAFIHRYIVSNEK